MDKFSSRLFASKYGTLQWTDNITSTVFISNGVFFVFLVFLEKPLFECFTDIRVPFSTITFTFVGKNLTRKKTKQGEVGRKWKDGFVDLMMHQVLKVEWQVKHPCYFSITPSCFFKAINNYLDNTHKNLFRVFFISKASYSFLDICTWIFYI